MIRSFIENQYNRNTLGLRTKCERRALGLGENDSEGPHHVVILVEEHVAMVDVGAVEARGEHYQELGGGGGRSDGSVLPATELLRVGGKGVLVEGAVGIEDGPGPGKDLEVDQVDVERVVFVGQVDDLPDLGGSGGHEFLDGLIKSLLLNDEVLRRNNTRGVIDGVESDGAVHNGGRRTDVRNIVGEDRGDLNIDGGHVLNSELHEDGISAVRGSARSRSIGLVVRARVPEGDVLSGKVGEINNDFISLTGSDLQVEDSDGGSQEALLGGNHVEIVNFGEGKEEETDIVSVEETNAVLPWLNISERPDLAVNNHVVLNG
jgi:hypothetical protein